MQGIQHEPKSWRRFAALGDSFSEGLMDLVGPDDRHLGWADRLAISLDRREPGLQYANLAIRGRKVPQVVDEQVPAAIALAPDLTSLAAGVNDALRKSFDLNATATAVENGVRALRGAGSDVILWHFGDPSRRSGLMKVVAHRIEDYGRATRAIAEVYGCYLVDLWGVAALDDDRWWDADRLHLSPRGHAAACAAALQALGLGDDRWRTPAAVGARPSVGARTLANAKWAKEHLSPWVVRRVRGRSSGDEITPKQPQWGPPPRFPG